MSSDGAPTARDAMPDAGRLPRSVGPVRLVRRLGAGGMATVYEAVLEEPRAGLPAGARVAVKLFHDAQADGERGLQRLRREASLAARVDHPAVVRPYELVEARDDGRTCRLLLMELVQGTTLRGLMADMGTIPEPLLRHLGAQLAAGLAAVHALGIVHRDVKPENVLIGADQQVKLADLGVARPLATTSDLTTTGSFLGSFAYASPEHLGVGTISPSSDLYSLGVLLYEATAGRRPFEHDSLGGLIRQHLEQRPRPLGEVAIQASPLLEELVGSLLDKDPARRLGSASELASILRDGEASAWWRARDGSATADEPARRRARVAHDARLVGREDDLARALEIARRALAGAGGALVLEGEAGVGKSRFADELLDAVGGEGSGVLVLRGEGGGPFGRGVIAESLVAHFGEARLGSALARELAATPSIVPALTAWLLGAPPPDGHGLGREALQAAVARLATTLAAERPVAWLIEDLHFASPEDRALAAALARASAGRRMLVVATTRPGSSQEDVAAWERLGARRLALPRLSARAVIDLLVGVLGSQRLAEDLGGRVAAKTDGNPYFVLEVARDLKQRGVVTRRADGTWSAKERISSIEVPTSVKSLLLERLSGVSPEERALLDVAAVQGFRFDGDLTARVLGQPRLQVLQALAVLERKHGLVRASGAAYHFDHHQLQEVLLAAIPEPLRVECHALVAESLIARAGLGDGPAADGELAVRIVRHALEGGLAAVASRHLLPALDHLRARLEFEATIDVCRLAVGRFLEGSREAALAGSRLSLALEKVSRLDDALAAGEAALRSALACGDAALEGQARQAILAARFHRNELAAAEEMARLGLDASRRAGDRFTEAKILGALGIVDFFQGRVDDAIADLQASVDTLAEIGFRGNLAVSMGNLATVLRSSLRPGAEELYRESIRIAEEVGELGHAALMEGNLGSALLERGEWAEGEAHVRRSLQRTRELGMLRTVAGNLQRLVDRAIALGELEEAERLIPEAADVAQAASDLRVLAKVRAAAGDVARLRGRADEARAGHDAGIETWRRARATAELAPALLRRARLAWEDGDAEGARSLLAEAETLAPQPDAHSRAWRAVLRDEPPPSIEDVAGLPLLQRLDTHGLLARAGFAGHAEAARELAESLARSLDAAARERFLRWGAGRHGQGGPPPA